MKLLIREKQQELAEICNKLQIKRMYIFGSAATEEFTDASDIDFLISFLDTLSIEDYTDNYFALHYSLRDLFDREIDIVTERSLSNRYFIESVNETKELIYEA
jgi:predicted nucleotidyltransferase